MKIAVVCDVLGKENNGTTVAAMNLIRYLKARGHEVRIVCADKDRARQEGFFVAPCLNLGRALNSYVAKIGVTIAKNDKKTVRNALEGVDHVHVLLPFFLGREAVKVASEKGLPVTASFHMQAQNFTSYLHLNKVGFVNRAVYKIIYRAVYRHVDVIHYPTEFIREVFERSIRKKTPGRVISNGIPSGVCARRAEKPAHLKDKIVILSTGRYSREKSQDTLIKALKYSKHRDNIQLVLAGHGIKEKYYKRLARGLPVPPEFKFFSREEMTDVLNYADIYVHPAEVELEGIACLEAIACGKLTVVSDSRHSATRHFAVDEKCIHKCRDPKDLARVIDYWIDRPDEAREYGEKYLRSAVAFDMDTCMREMEEMMIGAVNEKRKK